MFAQELLHPCTVYFKLIILNLLPLTSCLLPLTYIFSFSFLSALEKRCESIGLPAGFFQPKIL